MSDETWMKGQLTSFFAPKTASPTKRAVDRCSTRRTERDRVGRRERLGVSEEKA